MYPARNQFTVADLVNMDGVIFLLLATARESVAGKNDAVLIICENVLYILLKRTVRRRHSLLGKLIQTLLAAVRASDCSLSRNVEVPILRTSSEIAVQIPARERGVRFSDDRFYWMCHDASSFCAAGLLRRENSMPQTSNRGSSLLAYRHARLLRPKSSISEN
jgi:hypothetical protein